MFKKKAFTLIELLVVIAIIGILATVSVIAVGSARSRARDVRRVADIKQVQTALELFFNDNNRYPTNEEFSLGSIFSTSTGATSTYMQVIPLAPVPPDGSCTLEQNTFSYNQTEDGGSYIISFCLGSTAGSLIPGSKCLTPGGITNIDCSISGTPSFTCGDQLNVTTIAGYTCKASAPNYDTCTYNTVQIGTQCWMKQNMNIGNIINGSSNQTNNSPTPILEKYCYDSDGNLSDDTNCQTKGGLYQWNEAMQYSVVEPAQGICPDGWHIPSDAEWHILELGMANPSNESNCNGGRVSQYGCAPAGLELQNSSQFDALLTGLRYTNGSFANQNNSTAFWSSSVSGNPLNRILVGGNTVFRGPYSPSFGTPVRCLKN